MVNHMQRFFLALVAVLFLAAPTQGQSGDPLSKLQQENLDRIVDMLKNGQVKSLSQWVNYPLRRDNPIPDISNAQEFTLYYPILFDPVFREKLSATTFTTENTISRSGMLGLFNGDLWMDYDGRIVSVNYSSEAEKKLHKMLEAEEAKKLHKSVRDYDSNIMNCRCGNDLVRLDYMDDGEVRFALWWNGAEMSTEPGVLVKGGVTEAHGSMGGVVYKFSGGEYDYWMDKVNMAESEEQTGVFLRRLAMTEGLEDSSVRCEKLK